jgi:PAS domain S-box-containing protein
LTIPKKEELKTVSYQYTARKTSGLAWVMLFFGLIAALVATIYVKMDDETDAKKAFEFACNEIQSRMGARMEAHAQVLRSAAALFDASGEVTREQWHDFIRRQKVEQYLPGMQGIGFSLMIPRDKLVQHLQEIRSLGFPDYNVKPEGDRQNYTAIIYLEPFSGRNLRAFGYDMFSEPVRRKAMERARDLDAAAVSGKVILVQETDMDVQAGTLMYVPVYRKGMMTDTAAHRSAAIYGWVYSPYRMNDLMHGILRGKDLEAGKQIRLQIFDNGQLSDDSLIYDSHPKGEMGTVSASQLTLQTTMSLNDHQWFLRFIQADGQLSHIRVYGVFFAGAIISLLLFGLVISLLNTRLKAQRIAEQLIEDLKESEESYRNQFAHNSAVMLLIDPSDGAIIDANAAALVFYGYTRERLLAMHITDINALPASRLLEAMASVSPEQGQRFEFQHRLGDGSQRDVEVSTSRVQFGGRIVLHAIVHDITVRKQAEKALRESEACLRVITDSAQDAILMMDTKGLISYWNPAAERILGYNSTEAIGQNLHAFIVPPRYYEAHRAVFPVFQQTGQGAAVGKTLDLEARRKDGSGISVQLSLSAVHMSGGWHAVGILRDITERKRAEAELLEANLYLEEATARANHMAAQAEMANAAKSEFLANMSHEIRTPMNGVIGMSGLLLDTALSDEQRRYVEIVRTSGESLLAIINDILDFSKIEAGKLEFETLNFDLHDLMDDFAAMLAIRAQEKGLEFICAAAPDVPNYLRGDPGRLRQVLTNLAGNAVKFTHKGEIAVRARLVSETDEEALIRFSVRDDGIGIPSEKKDILFQKFSQVDASTTRKYGGTGLGLAISKQLAEMMGGEIGVDSENGKGSAFWFTARFAKQTERERVFIPPAEIRGVHLLVVDDNATNREVLLAQLKAWGVRAEEAPSGPTALQSLCLARDAQDPFRMAILDMQMPGMDGAALAGIIKSDETLKDTHLILLSSLSQRGDARRMKAFGFSGYLTKPARQPDIIGCMTAVLGRESMPHPDKTIVTRHTIREMGRGAIRILLADDNIVNQQVALGILKKMGLHADAVANGAEAVKALEILPYDIVLMDVQMPVMDGLEATRQIRNPECKVRNPGVPVIAMTARTMKEDREECLEAGMNDFIAKPVDPGQLAEVLYRWLKDKTEKRERETGAEKADPVPVPDFHFQNSTIFDKSDLMKRLLGDKDFATTIIEGFLMEMPKELMVIKELVEQGQAKQAGAQAHKIRGAAGSIGSPALQEIANAMEKAGKDEEIDLLRALMPEMEKQYAQLRQALEANNP